MGILKSSNLGGNMKSIITALRRRKMAEATNLTGQIAKAKWIALGSGGADSQGGVISPDETVKSLANEKIRKEIIKSKKTSDTSYEYYIELSESELVGEYISELALIDEDGDIIALSNFLPKGKDSIETTFAIEDSY